VGMGEGCVARGGLCRNRGEPCRGKGGPCRDRGWHRRDRGGLCWDGEGCVVMRRAVSWLGGLRCDRVGCVMIWEDRVATGEGCNESGESCVTIAEGRVVRRAS